MKIKKVNISASWKKLFQEEFEKDYFKKLANTVREKYKTGIVYPHPSKIFNAFNLTSVKNVKVVIIGQDPYHGENQANGLCFSVEKGIPIPPSLKNIYKELESDLGIASPSHGSLQKWATQGVLLLNSVLTVDAGIANSHKGYGWEDFTRAAINILSKKRKNLVFILWGKNAQEKEKIINSEKHLILKSAHPSPLSAYNGFWGSKHFSKTNEYLKSNHLEIINWNID
tara:strand:- start:19 stop:699 length:681 start_codon:yes stop_codon:yes gene_type:complete